MSPLTVAWSMCAAACVMLGLMHLLLFYHQRRMALYLLSSLMAFAAAAETMLELALMKTQSIETYGSLLIWQNGAVFALLISMVWFVYLYFDNAQLWLARLISALWCVALIINFLSPYSLVFSGIDELRQIELIWGETFTHALGTTHPWKVIADGASVLIAWYFISSSIRTWRAGHRRRAGLIGGAMTLFIVVAGVHAPLVDAGLVATPYMVSFAFLAIVFAMTYELVREAVTARRLALDFSSSEARWSSLVESIDLAIVGVDAQGKVNFANRFFERLSGYRLSQLHGEDVERLVPLAGVEALNRRLDEAAPEGPQPRARATLVTAAGDRRQMDWTLMPLLAPDGSHAGFLSIGADVTESIRARMELQRAEREMERLARVGMLGELTSALAHELNQPLAAILSNAQAARRFIDAGNQEPGEIRDILEDIIRDDKRAGTVIHGLRAMLSKGEINWERLPVDAVAAEAIELVKGELEEQTIDVQLSATANLQPVNAGRVALQQVVVNLLLNAMHAMRNTPPSNRSINVRVDVRDTDVVVAVEDNGHGIAADQMAQIFEPFFTTASSGMGMGLAICRRMLQSHGGRIWAENNASGGATFSFSLPVEQHKDPDG